MTTLIEELSKPEYADLVAANDYEGLEAVLTASSISEPAKGTSLTELGILDLLGPANGDAFLSGIEAAAASMPVLNRVVRWLRSDRGVDVGNAQVQAVLGQLVAAGAVTAESAALVIAYGTRTISIAEKLQLGTVGHGAIVNALKEMKE